MANFINMMNKKYPNTGDSPFSTDASSNSLDVASIGQVCLVYTDQQKDFVKIIRYNWRDATGEYSFLQDIPAEKLANFLNSQK